MKKILTIALLFMIMTASVSVSAVHAESYCTRETFIKMVLTACNVAYNDDNYIEQAKSYGLLKSKTFSNYSWKLTKTDMAILLVRADYYRNHNSWKKSAALQTRSEITDIDTVSYARGLYVAKAINAGLMPDITIAYNPLELTVGVLDKVTLSTANNMISILLGESERLNLEVLGNQTEITPTPVSTETNSDYTNEVLALMNAERAAVGLEALTLTSNLSKAATARAIEISDYFSHTRPDGTTCFTIFKEYGISYSYAGENIAYGQSTPEAVMDSWMSSEGHKENILSENFNHVGIGCYYKNGRYYWTQDFTN